MSSSISLSARLLLVLAVTVLLASCGARSGFNGSGDDGEGPPDMLGASDPSNPSAPPLTLTDLPCTGSTGRLVGLSETMRIGPCQWHSAGAADPSRPALKFTQNERSLPLTLVDGPDGCDAVSGQGWYLVENVPGIIVKAPVVMTFDVCPEACREVMASDGWLLSYEVNTCG